MPKRINLKQMANYTNERIDLSFERYIGHRKVIRYAAGLPVYTLSLPPVYSSAFANFLANLSYKETQGKPAPFLVSVAITDICNAKCEHCSFFTSLDDPDKQPLSAEELMDFIHQAQDLGACVFDFVGGETLMHPRWREIFQSVDKRRSHVFLFTNGWFLAEAAAGLHAAGVGGVYVSLDACEAEAHDRKRGLPGLFAKAMEGIEAAKKADLTVSISCCIDEEDFERGELDRIIELGRRQGVHEVLVFDAVPVGRFSARDDLRGNKTWQEQMIEHVKVYNQNDSYPGVLIYAYTTSHMSLGCPGGTCYLYMTPYGEICPCDFHHRKFGNIREEPLAVIWDRMSQRLGCRGSSLAGCRAKL